MKFFDKFKLSSYISNRLLIFGALVYFLGYKYLLFTENLFLTFLQLFFIILILAFVSSRIEIPRQFNEFNKTSNLQIKIIFFLKIFFISSALLFIFWFVFIDSNNFINIFYAQNKYILGKQNIIQANSKNVAQLYNIFSFSGLFYPWSLYLLIALGIANQKIIKKSDLNIAKNMIIGNAKEYPSLKIASYDIILAIMTTWTYLSVISYVILQLVNFIFYKNYNSCLLKYISVNTIFPLAILVYLLVSKLSKNVKQKLWYRSKTTLFYMPIVFLVLFIGIYFSGYLSINSLINNLNIDSDIPCLNLAFNPQQYTCLTYAYLFGMSFIIAPFLTRHILVLGKKTTILLTLTAQILVYCFIFLIKKNFSAQYHHLYIQLIKNFSKFSFYYDLHLFLFLLIIFFILYTHKDQSISKIFYTCRSASRNRNSFNRKTISRYITFATFSVILGRYFGVSFYFSTLIACVIFAILPIYKIIRVLFNKDICR